MGVEVIRIAKTISAPRIVVSSFIRHPMNLLRIHPTLEDVHVLSGGGEDAQALELWEHLKVGPWKIPVTTLMLVSIRDPSYTFLATMKRGLPFGVVIDGRYNIMALYNQKTLVSLTLKVYAGVPGVGFLLEQRLRGVHKQALDRLDRELNRP